MNKNIVIFSIFLLSALMMTTCSNLFETPQTTNNSEPNGMLIVRLGGEERTLAPSEDMLAELSYKLIISRSGGDIAFNGTFTSSAVYDLAPGNWTVNVEAYSEDNLVAIATEEVNIIAGQTTQANMTLLPAYSIETAGTFYYKISYPDSEDPTNAIGYSSATLRLNAIDQINSGLVSIDMLADPEKREGTLDLPPGCYIMTIDIISTRQIEGQSLRVNRVDVVYIYPRLTTNAVFSFALVDFTAFVRLAGTANVYKYNGISEDANFIPVQVSVFDDNNILIKDGEIVKNNGEYEWELYIPSHHLSRSDLNSVNLSFKAANVGDPAQTITSLWQSSDIYYPHGNHSISLSMRTQALDIGSVFPGTGGSIDFVAATATDDWVEFTITNPVNYGLIADTLRINSSYAQLDNIKSENGKIHVRMKVPSSGIPILYANFFHLNGSLVINAQNPAGHVPKKIEAFEPGVGETDKLIASAIPIMSSYNNYEWEISIPSDYVWRAVSKRCRLESTLEAVGEMDQIWKAVTDITNLTTDVDIVPAIFITNLFEGTLLILQAYGTGGSSQNGVNRSFVELYNATNAAVDLDGYTLYFAEGTRGLPPAEKDWDWSWIDLSGMIQPKGSFLILGPNDGGINTRYNIEAEYGDIVRSNFILSNRSFKVALLHGSTRLTEAVQNPFDIDGDGTKFDGYIDMVGAANDPDHATNPDQILGFETSPARNSGSEAVRRKDLVDTNNNSIDFIAARYASNNGMTDEELEARRPRNSAVGSWDPFQTPTGSTSMDGLMLFQVHGTGFVDTNGTNRNTGSVSHSFVELYNNSNAAIDLSTYSVQWANGIANGGGTVLTEIGDWNVIPLSGTIPAYGSYLIRGKQANAENGQVGRLQITEFDKDAGDVFEMSNRSFKVALVSSQTKLALSNPWNNTSSAPLVPELADLFGARNGSSDSVDAFIGQLNTSYTKQQSMRRNKLTVSANNSTDFTGIDYRTADLVKFRPRTTSAGSWTPEF